MMSQLVLPVTLVCVCKDQSEVLIIADLDGKVVILIIAIRVLVNVALSQAMKRPARHTTHLRQWR